MPGREAVDWQRAGAFWCQQVTARPLPGSWHGTEGVLLMTRMQDGLTHVLEYCDADEPSGA